MLYYVNMSTRSRLQSLKNENIYTVITGFVDPFLNVTMFKSRDMHF